MAKDGSMLVSVIVPVYNVEKYLSKCLKSLEEQSYDNFEVIIINDGSTDNSLEICEEFVNRNTNMKLYSQQNSGLSAARNKGLENSKGEYVCFVDSDDYVSKDYLETLVSEAKSSDCDIVACDFLYVNEFDKTWSLRDKELKLYSSAEAIVDLLTVNCFTEFMVWNKIYKRKLFIDNHLEFEVGRIHEDNFIMYKLYDKANKIKLIPNKLYYYLSRGDSITGKKFNKKRFDILVALEQTYEYFDGRFMEELECYELLVYIGLVNSMLCDGYNEEGLMHCVKFIKKRWLNYINNSFVTYRIQIGIILLKFNWNIYKYYIIKTLS